MSDPKVITEKPEGSKHYENTSEYSKPHTSEGHPEEHVDQLTFGEGGKHDSQHDTDGITDEGAKEMGQQTYDLHQHDKDNEE